MIDSILKLDIQATVSAKNLIPHNKFFDIFFSFLSLVGFWQYIWIILLVILARKFLLPLILNIGVTLVSVEILKMIFQRLRPEHLNFICNGFSFPSGHAATAFAAATLFVHYDKKKAWIYYLLAFLISLSRIYLGCHYFSDVVIGAILGYLMSTLIIKQQSKTYR